MNNFSTLIKGAVLCAFCSLAIPGFTQNLLYFNTCPDTISCVLHSIDVNTCDTAQIMNIPFGALTFAPDGRLYCITSSAVDNSITAYEIDVDSRSYQLVFSRIITGITLGSGFSTAVFDENGYCYLGSITFGWGRFYWPNGNLEIINNSVTYGSAYNHSNSQIYVTPIQPLLRSVLRTYDPETNMMGPILVENGEIFSGARRFDPITWAWEDCNSPVLYGSSRVSQPGPFTNHDTIVRFEPLTFQTIPVCYLDFSILTLTSPYEYQPYQCAFEIDLDSGAAGVDYRADTLCYDLISPVTAATWSLHAQSGRIDSIVVWAEGSLAGQLYTDDPLPAPLSAQGINTARLTLAGRSPDAENDYRAALASLRFRPADGPGNYTIAVAGFDRAYGRSDTARMTLYYLDNPYLAGADGNLHLCADSPPSRLADVLGPQAHPGGLWVPAPTGPDASFVPGTDLPGDYSYIVAGRYGCPSDTAVVRVGVSALPTPDLGADTILCAGQSMVLSAPAGNWQISWTGGSTAPQISVALPGTYRLELRDAADCSVADSIVIGFHPQPDTGQVQAVICPGESYLWLGELWSRDTSVCRTLTQALTGCDSVSCLRLQIAPALELNFGPDRLLCPGDTVTLSLPPGLADYRWSTGESGPLLRTTAAGLYSATATDSWGCTAADTIHISLAALSWTAQASPPSCQGYADGALRLELPAAQGPYHVRAGGRLFVNEVLSGLSAGAYPIEIEDARGCRFFDTLTLSEPSAWSIVLPATSFSIRSGDTLHIQAQTAPAQAIAGWLWTPPLHISCDTCAQVRLYPGASQEYELRAENEQGCVQTARIIVAVLQREYGVYAPNAFSPNDDGINDRWFIASGPEGFTAEAVQIFNRWGGLVYEARNVDSGTSWGWDGRHKNEPAEAGVYVYRALLRFDDGKILLLSGEISLLR